MTTIGPLSPLHGQVMLSGAVMNADVDRRNLAAEKKPTPIVSQFR